MESGTPKWRFGWPSIRKRGGWHQFMWSQHLGLRTITGWTRCGVLSLCPIALMSGRTAICGSGLAIQFRARSTEPERSSEDRWRVSYFPPRRHLGEVRGRQGKIYERKWPRRKRRLNAGGKRRSATRIGCAGLSRGSRQRCSRPDTPHRM